MSDEQIRKEIQVYLDQVSKLLNLKVYLARYMQDHMTKKYEWTEAKDFYYIKPTEFGQGTPYGVVYQQENGLGKYTTKVISQWTMYEMPHCCAFLISCSVWVDEKYRNKGVGTILNNLRVKIAEILEYSAILCTDIGQNAPQRTILKKNGWEDVYKVKNKRTHNMVFLSVKTIK